MSNIFNTDNCIQWWCLLALMFLSFLLGWLLARYFTKKLYSDDLDHCLQENKKLKNSKGVAENEHAKTIFKDEGTVKAVKTMERSGVKVKNNEGLNFASFGAATAAEKDDLKKISGVGPVIEGKLNSIGIYTFDQISRFTDTDIQQATDLIQFFPGRILRDDWRGQAEILKEGGETDFSKRVDNKDVDYNKKEDERYGKKE